MDCAEAEAGMVSWGESAKRFAHVFAYMRELLSLGMYEMGWVFQRVLSGCADLVVSYTW